MCFFKFGLQEPQMHSVILTYDEDNDLTYLKIKGNLTFETISKIIDDVYATEQLTYKIICDLTESNISNLNASQVELIVNKVQGYISKRKEGKTAIVHSGDFEYGMGRIFEVYTEIKNFPATYQMFRSLDEAFEWLGIDKETLPD
jgi:hypothetical protein